ncbi:hypothetical protein OIDMADRAFT_52984 [Oidiodendron maius Zn]|uniref:Uncharacterized protein n=1 Tax=Oidiodendron maius (strain Zn) TaxID=913774 RepID=A0A0C3HLJ7_OIDMZ|nr:hypothetical protein OIDMADRAFT_52984 [Oidiodendron maius Zn]
MCNYRPYKYTLCGCTCIKLQWKCPIAVRTCCPCVYIPISPLPRAISSQGDRSDRPSMAGEDKDHEHEHEHEHRQRHELEYEHELEQEHEDEHHQKQQQQQAGEEIAEKAKPQAYVDED